MIWGENPLFVETPTGDLFVDPIAVHLPLTAQETSIEAQIDTARIAKDTFSQPKAHFCFKILKTLYKKRNNDTVEE